MGLDRILESECKYYSIIIKYVEYNWKTWPKKIGLTIYLKFFSEYYSHATFNNKVTILKIK